MNQQILTWQKAFQSTVEQCGGKGFNLARLHHYGFQIPRGGVITSQIYAELIAESSFQTLIQQVSKLSPAKLIESNNTLLDSLRNAFIQTKLSDAFKTELATFLTQQNLSNAFVSIRSSVNQEDSESASFAGIHDSILNIRGVENIERAILKGFASLWSPRAIAYRRKMKISDNNVTMAIVINEMVTAQSAGVAFSCDPGTGRHDVITINANYGLGESVVSGAVEPDQYRLNRFHKTIIDKDIGQKQQICRAKSDGGTEWISTESPERECLTTQQLKQLATLCDRVFHALGQGEKHQDIEWAFNGHDIILLQARPVTAIKKVACSEISDQAEIWSNGNFRDAVPMVLARCMSEFCDQHINEIMHANFDSFYLVDPALRFSRQFEGRFYCNASLLQWLWFDAVDFPPDKTNISLGGHQTTIKIDLQYTKGFGKKLTRIWRGIKFFRLMSVYRKKAPEIIKTEITFAETNRKITLPELTDQQLIEILQTLNKHMSEYNRSFIMLTSQSGALFMLVQTLERYVKERAFLLANALMARQANITSANHGYQLQALAQLLRNDEPTLQTVLDKDFQPTKWKTQLPENTAFKKDFSEYIERYGHRSIYEIDLGNARWREDPSYLFDCIRANLNAPYLTNSERNHQQQNDVAWQEVRRCVPRYMHGLIKKQLNAAVAGAELKELSKSIYIRLLEPMRLTLLEVGRRLLQRKLIDNIEDVFHCARCELDAVMRGNWDGEALKTLIDERKVIKLRQEQVPAVDVIFDDTPQQLTAQSSKKGGGLRGIGVAPGMASGCARLIRTPREGSRLQPGDILVAPSTDPAWTPLFLNAAAIVVETGGYLSHGSIVAREYGIPAVVNIPGVFSTVMEGDSINVNGDQGFVEVLS